MKRIGHFALSQFSFVCIIFLEIISKGAQGNPETVLPFMAAATSALLINVILLVKFKHKDYFPFAIFFVMLAGFAAYFLYPPLNEWFLLHVITGLYAALFLSAAIPPIMGFHPFTYFYSADRYPAAIVRSKQFKKVNLIINWIWAALFLTCVFLSGVRLSDNPEHQFYLSVLLPIGLQLTIGVPSIFFIPRITSLRMHGPRLLFETCREMFESMPLGLNAKKAKGISAVYQFCITGKENITGFLTIKDQKCFYKDGISDKFTVKISTDSELWLKISNGELSGQKELMANRYSVEGDLDYLQKFDELFSTENPGPSLKERIKNIFRIDQRSKFTYQTRNPGEIKKILLIDGSTRARKFSKSLFIAEKFAQGAISAGAQVETIKVRSHNIRGCSGCYNCFSKTPGKCSQKDDMREILEKINLADLIVFVSPLYFFSISSQLKAFIDRMLPLMEPWMEIQSNIVTHSMRQKNRKNIPMVVFSAGGFPDVEKNFDGISGMFRALHHHNFASGGGLMGEFYLPAAEMIVQPVYRERKEMVANACINAGKQVVQEGKIDIKYMAEVSHTGISKETFQSQANNYWEMLNGQSYDKFTPGI
jgi:multimeric flavodoxin WrbA